MTRLVTQEWAFTGQKNWACVTADTSRSYELDSADRGIRAELALVRWH